MTEDTDMAYEAQVYIYETPKFFFLYTMSRREKQQNGGRQCTIQYIFCQIHVKELEGINRFCFYSFFSIFFYIGS